MAKGHLNKLVSIICTRAENSIRGSVLNYIIHVKPEP